MLQTEIMENRTIDRDLDQTAPHFHQTGQPCPTCKSVNEFHTGEKADPEHLEPPFNRHVSPSILEFRIQELEKQLRQKERRIEQFEILTRRLSEHLDDLMKIAGVTKPHTLRPAA